MQKWCTEDWQFELTVIRGKAGHCRLGLEKGDKFIFSYGCVRSSLGVWALPDALCNTKAKPAIKQNDK